MSIKVLDCTLRDGGYVNNWEFMEENISEIIQLFIDANIDYVECGFLKNSVFDPNKTLFNSFDQLKKYLPGELMRTKIFAMIDCDSLDLTRIKPNENPSFAIRIAFKKSQIDIVINEAKILKEKGYNVFLNPMHTITYSDLELLNLIENVNSINPYGMAIVDTTGTMKKHDVSRLFYLIDSNLNKNIALCFHSHNSLQLSFSNAQELISLNKNRELIIDSSVFGMGRGAGNLPTELLTQYLNDNCNANYNLIPILKISDEYINKIFVKSPWGYSVPYYLAATNNCHPNYATFLVDKQTVPIEVTNSILKNIPDNKKNSYDKELISQMYLDYQSHFVDDRNASITIKNEIQDRNILLLAPGNSIKNHQDVIQKYIEENNCYVISLNFEVDEYKVDKAFFTNTKRFNAVKELKYPAIISSNIKNSLNNTLIINYSSYLNKSAMPDNVALMMFSLLIKLGVKNVAIAGLDGLSINLAQNYFADDLIQSAKINEIELNNKTMKEEINTLKSRININFITPTLYE